ncbi:hypothetical protein GRX01_05070 [Halobaculum sp. WSA2]|uniref:HD domain-containing protein n=1 Tax=Halobaculum saliterrae TaxID=2073113 RepID=A0A6B0SVR6_9EURY|nr:hypothetical protein [Halobaculum saliterrae]MXR40713.1 hypothetical protein [Halobaculum saliterrae]
MEVSFTPLIMCTNFIRACCRMSDRPGELVLGDGLHAGTGTTASSDRLERTSAGNWQRSPDSEMDPELTPSQQSALQALVTAARDHIAAQPQETAGLNIAIVGPPVRDAILDRPGRDLAFVVTETDAATLRERGFDPVPGSDDVVQDATGTSWRLPRRPSVHSADLPVGDTDDESGELRMDLRGRGLRVDALAVWLTSPDSSVAATESHQLDIDPAATLLDPFDGLNDIAAGRLRHTPGAFDTDPLCVVRTARRAAELGAPGSSIPESTPGPTPATPDTFAVAESTRARMAAVIADLNLVDRDRLGDEIQAAMAEAVDPRRFWEVLADVGGLAVLASTLDRGRIVPAGPEMFHAEGDVFTHAMEVLDQMHARCVDADITGQDRVRRYLMAIAHDLGKVPIANEGGGLHSEDPPTSFPNHSTRGKAPADRLATRLGLPDHVGEAMVDAADLHMTVPDVVTWEPDRLLEFIEAHTRPQDDALPDFATVEELLDLIRADHQGRWQARTSFDRSSAYYEDPTLPNDVVRPRFHETAYETRVETARTALEEIDGHTILRRGLCRDHAEGDLENDALAATARRCADCRSPGAWVGEELAAARQELLTDDSG